MSTDEGRTNDGSSLEPWLVPGLCFVLGLGMLVIQVVRDEPVLGAVMLAIMWGYGAVVVVLRRRTEIGDLLGGGATDERRSAIQVQALAVTGQVLIVVLVSGFLVQLARGADTHPWVGLGALGGATYLLSLVVIRARSWGSLPPEVTSSGTARPAA